MFLELWCKTIDINKKTKQKKKNIRESFPYFSFRYHPDLLSFLKSPGTLYAPQVAFTTVMLQYCHLIFSLFFSSGFYLKHSFSRGLFLKQLNKGDKFLKKL